GCVDLRQEEAQNRAELDADYLGQCDFNLFNRLDAFRLERLRIDQDRDVVASADKLERLPQRRVGLDALLQGNRFGEYVPHRLGSDRFIRFPCTSAGPRRGWSGW